MRFLKHIYEHELIARQCLEITSYAEYPASAML
jgi:hypothetical protein